MSKDQAERLYIAVCAWRDKTKPSCVEAIFQVDRFTLESQYLAEICCDIVGYHDEPDEDT